MKTKAIKRTQRALSVSLVILLLMSSILMTPVMAADEAPAAETEQIVDVVQDEADEAGEDEPEAEPEDEDPAAEAGDKTGEPEADVVDASEDETEDTAAVQGEEETEYADPSDTSYELPDLRDQATPPEAPVAQYEDDEVVTIIVELESPTVLDVPTYLQNYNSRARSSTRALAAYRNNLVNAQEEVQGKIAEISPDALFKYHYTNLINGFAAKVPYGDLEAIQEIDGVLAAYVTVGITFYIDVIEDEEEQVASRAAASSPITPFADFGSVDLMDMQAAYDAGYTGAGQVVAVFDSSLQVTHEQFSYMDPIIAQEKPGNYKTKEGLLTIIEENHDTLNLFTQGWGSWFHEYDETGFSQAVQHEILNGGFYYNEKVPFAVDYQNGDLDVTDRDSGGVRRSDHGTHVSGIVAGNPGPNKENGAVGGAKDAQIMFFKIFDEFDSFGQEADEAVFAALDDAVTLGADAYNLSLGIPNGFGTALTPAQAGYQRAYNRARAVGINIAVSAGNDGRDTHPGSNFGRTSTLPNGAKVGFSGSLFSPFTVASAQNVGYRGVYYYLTNMVLTDEDGNSIYANIELRDNNPTALGTLLDETYELVYAGEGTVDEVAALDLDGKVVLVSGSGNVVAAQESAYDAGAVAVIVINTENRIVVITDIWNASQIPVLGSFPSSQGADLVALLENGTVNVSFTSQRAGTSTSASYNDNGPVSSTSWGVTETLKLKPDIMAPGGNVWSSTYTTDTSYGQKSGTSMASPNMEGAFILVRQGVDDKIAEGIFDVQPGTVEYADLVEQLVGSTAKVYRPLNNGTNYSDRYFSPRRQGSGMVQVGKAITSNVLLNNSNTVEYDPATGESPRSKVELGDKLDDVFTFSFMLENHNSSSRRFNVSAVAQTDAVTYNASTDRYALAAPSSTGAEVDPFSNAVITVKSIDGGSVIINSDNINRYADNYNSTSASSILVPANTSVEIIMEVDITALDFDYYEKAFPNGMFVEGYVFFESDYENVNLSYMGFYGDYLKAPIFDTADAYTDVSDKAMSDADYPMYQVTSLNTQHGTSELALGVNQFTGRSLSPYNVSGSGPVATNRTYFSTMRQNGDISKDFIAISPNGDGYYEYVYANLALLRNAKALVTVVRDNAGEIVKVLGPEYEYFELLNSDGNRTQQIASTHGSKYLRDMGWNGTDEAGEIVDDGEYTLEIYGMLEYEYLNTLGYAAPDEEVLDALLTSDTVEKLTFPVKVDTAAPAMTSSAVDDNKIDLTVEDASGIQAVAIYYQGVQVGDTIRVNDTTFTHTFDLDSVAPDGGLIGKLPINPVLVQIQAVDYAFNIRTIGANESAGTEEPGEPEDPDPNPGPDPEPEPDVETIAIDSDDLVALKRGTTLQLTAVVTPDEAVNATITWSSSNSDIASIDADGTVTAIKPGTARITATANGKTDMMTIRVTA